MLICHAGQVRWVVFLRTRITGHAFIHSFLQDYVLMESTNPFPTGPVLHRWLVGFYLSNLFSFIPSLALLFSFLKPTVNEYAELDKSALKRLLGLSVFCPPFSFIVSSLSYTPCWFSSKLPKSLIKFLQINAHQLHTSHFYDVPATFIFLDSHARLNQPVYNVTWHQQFLYKTNITEVQEKTISVFLFQNVQLVGFTSNLYFFGTNIEKYITCTF